MKIADRSRFSPENLFRQTGPLSPDHLAVIKSHPRFLEAVRAASSSLLAIQRKPRRLTDDLGRLVISHLALYLHFSRDATDPRSGLSISRMTALCVEQRVCSRGRSLAVLTALRLAGYLNPVPNQNDRRLRLLSPTEQLIVACRQYWEALFVGTVRVIRAPFDASAALENAEVFAAFMCVFGLYFCAGVRLVPAGSKLTSFAHRSAGLGVLWSMLLACEPHDPRGPSPPVPVSIAVLARRFGVSRTQVLRILDDAVAVSFLERRGGDGLMVSVLPPLVDAMANFYVTAFSLSDHYMRRALDAAARGR
jgi:hypothetical protein